MKQATHESLDNQQRAFRDQLGQAVAQINQADTLLQQSPEATQKATALLLSAIARVYVLEVAEKFGMDNRLPAFTNKPTA